MQYCTSIQHMQCAAAWCNMVPSTAPFVVQALAVLLENDMAHVAKINPRQVGVHPDNRDGYGVNQADVHELGSEIFRMGWSWDQTTQAWASCNSRFAIDCSNVQCDRAACTVLQWFSNNCSSGVSSYGSRIARGTYRDRGGFYSTVHVRAAIHNLSCKCSSAQWFQ